MIRKKKAKCPHCEALHEYSEVVFPVVNDYGYWTVSCEKCEETFGVYITNPVESSMNPNYLIIERREGEPKPELVIATEIIEYNINFNKVSLQYDYESAPLYICNNNGLNLEVLAGEALEAAFEELRLQYCSVVNYCLANRTHDYEFFVAEVEISCSCGFIHKAMFYCPFRLNGSTPQSPSEFLLADIDGVELATELTGVFTKTDIMAFLEKLIIRWNLRATSIVMASPFVGHQYLKKEEKLEVWNWLLSKLDYRKAIFITRTSTLNSYKKLICDQDGLNYELLREYDLENHIVSANTKKNDFHAKFFAGLDGKSSEILSGSANLVQGPSMENCSFQASKREIFLNRYWKPLKVNIDLHPVKTRHWLACSFQGGSWRTTPQSGTEI